MKNILFIIFLIIILINFVDNKKKEKFSDNDDHCSVTKLGLLEILSYDKLKDDKFIFNNEEKNIIKKIGNKSNIEIFEEYKKIFKCKK